MLLDSDNGFMYILPFNFYSKSKNFITFSVGFWSTLRKLFWKICVKQVLVSNTKYINIENINILVSMTILLVNLLQGGKRWWSPHSVIRPNKLVMTVSKILMGGIVDHIQNVSWQELNIFHPKHFAVKTWVTVHL